MSELEAFLARVEAAKLPVAMTFKDGALITELWAVGPRLPAPNHTTERCGSCNGNINPHTGECRCSD